MALVYDEDKHGWANAAAIADVASADATDAGASYVEATAQTAVDLANEIKAQLNSVLAALRDANIIAGD